MQYAAICSIAFVFLAVCSEIGHSKEEIDTKILSKTPFPYIDSFSHGDVMLCFWTIVFLISVAVSVFYTITEIQYMSSAEGVSVVEYAWRESPTETVFATLCIYTSYFLVAVQYKFMCRIAAVARLYRKWNYAHSAYPREFASLFLSAYGIGALSQCFAALFYVSFYNAVGYTETLATDVSQSIGKAIAIIFWGIVFHFYWKTIDKRFKNMQQMDGKRINSNDNIPKDLCAADESRLAELRAELQKIPVPKVKQWYAEGKLTEEQYRIVAKKYSAIRKEMTEIQERLDQAYDILSEGQNNGT